MPTIEFLPADKRVEAAHGTPLVTVARQAGIEIDLPCGGDGSCGRCVVRAKGGGVETASLGRIPSAAVASGYVLACRTRIQDDPVTIELPEKTESRGQFADQDEPSLIDPGLLPTKDEIAPLAQKWFLKTKPPQLDDGRSDVDRITQAIRDHRTIDEISCSLAAARSAATAVREENGRVTATLRVTDPGVRILEIEPGDTRARHYGVAVDVGTTSVAVQLVYLPTGAVLATESDYNGQIPCGVDVIGRINYAARPARLEELRTRVLETINHLIFEAAFSRGVNPGEICQAAVAGNTVMTHLLLGLQPEFIRLEPYTPTVLRPPMLCAADIGLGIGSEAPVELAPCV